MLTRCLLFLVLSALISCTKHDPRKFYMPAEWEPHDAVWLGWEDGQIYFSSPMVEAVKAMIPHVQIKIAASSDSLLRVAKKYIYEQKIDTTSIRFYTMPGERYWIRDHGAAFLVNEEGELGVADFGWSLYGYPGWLERSFNGQQDSIKKWMKRRMKKETGAIDSMMAVAEGASILKTEVIHEGGAIEVNGKGTLILCEATVMQRNPRWNRDDLEKEFMRVLGVSKIIWMKKGLADDPHYTERISGDYFGFGTGGHTDEFVRFADERTVLLAWVNESEKNAHPINQINYQRMNENLTILEQSTDQDGNPFRIIKVPAPDPIVRKVMVKGRIDDLDFVNVESRWFLQSEAPQAGDTLLHVSASSYLNYLVTNEVVLLPTYTHAGSSAEKEKQVKRIFEEVFPGRELVWIDCMPQNWSGGGIHCSTQQQPKRRE